MIASLLGDHLVRLLFWGALSVALGLVTARRTGRLGPFGVMTVGWGLVNLAIALVSLARLSETNLETLRPFLALNIGLNMGYIGVGTTMAVLATHRDRIVGFGLAVVVQGVALLLLDGLLYFLLSGAR